METTCMAANRGPRLKSKLANVLGKPATQYKPTGAGYSEIAPGVKNLAVGPMGNKPGTPLTAGLPGAEPNRADKRAI